MHAYWESSEIGYNTGSQPVFLAVQRKMVGEIKGSIAWPFLVHILWLFCQFY